MKIKDRVCVVTGAAGGIGEAIARRFAKEGAKGVVVADRDAARLEKVAKDIGGFAVGIAAHGIGTARAFQVDEVAGVFAGIAMSLNALVTSLLVPVAVTLLVR